MSESFLRGAPYPVLCLLLDEPSKPGSNLCLPPFILALPQPHPSCSLPFPKKPRAPGSQCGPASPTTELTRRWGERGRRKAGGLGRRDSRRREARGEETPGTAAADTQRAAERWGDFTRASLFFVSLTVYVYIYPFVCLYLEMQSFSNMEQCILTLKD